MREQLSIRQISRITGVSTEIVRKYKVKETWENDSKYGCGDLRLAARATQKNRPPVFLMLCIIFMIE